MPASAPERRVWLRAVGDIMPARGVERQWSGQHGLADLFAAVRPLLRAPDITFANLEATLAHSGKRAKPGISLRAHPNAIFALTDAGLDVVSLANNHAEDFGPDALCETRARLERAGISVAGATRAGERRGAEAVLERHGLRTAFLAYNVFKPSALRISDDPLSLALVADDVRQVKESADFVVVSFHWGIEYQREPTDRQRALGHTAIDAGADLVLGHHPHRLQGVEIYDGRPIVYSLGNFLFDQPHRQQRDTVIADWQAGEAGSRSLTLIPTRIARTPFAPRVLIGAEAEELLDAYRSLAADLGTSTRIEEGRVRILGMAGDVSARGPARVVADAAQ